MEQKQKRALRCAIAKDVLEQLQQLESELVKQVCRAIKLAGGSASTQQLTSLLTGSRVWDRCSPVDSMLMSVLATASSPQYDMVDNDSSAGCNGRWWSLTEKGRAAIAADLHLALLKS